MRSTVRLGYALLTLLALPALAHTHLLQATPADGTTVDAPPKQLRLMYSEAASLTALSIQKVGDPASRKLGPLPKQVAASFAIDLPPLVAGSYLVKWRALSDDNHLASGSIHFSVRAQ